MESAEMTTEPQGQGQALNLGNYDIALLVDKSGSMQEKDGPGGMSRWDAAKEASIALAHAAAKYDSDGITVAPFAGSWKVYENVTPDKMAQVFAENEPMGTTNTASVLNEMFEKFFSRKASGTWKPLIIQVITDGAPDSKDDVKKVIIAATQKMDKDEELAVQFIQYGNDPAVPAFLKELDDDLQAQGAKFDIVDYKTWQDAENIPLADLLLQAIND